MPSIPRRAGRSKAGTEENLTNQRFGRLTVLSGPTLQPGQPNNAVNRLWECLCDCGTRLALPERRIKHDARSCGCLQSEITAERNRKGTKTLEERYSPDLTGQRFGRLVALHESQRFISGKRLRVYWLCRCDCGNDTEVSADNLRYGLVQSCWCLRREVTGDTHRTHGGRQKPEYYIWFAAKQRCENPNNASYANYGARGIRVCDRWHSFSNFIADMGERPTPQHTLERRSNALGYSPENCFWATRAEQSRNRRNCINIEFQGRTLTATEWAREIGIPASRIIKRFKAGWPVEKVLSPQEFNSGPRKRRHG